MGRFEKPSVSEWVKKSSSRNTCASKNHKMKIHKSHHHIVIKEMQHQKFTCIICDIVSLSLSISARFWKNNVDEDYDDDDDDLYIIGAVCLSVRLSVCLSQKWLFSNIFKNFKIFNKFQNLEKISKFQIKIKIFKTFQNLKKIQNFKIFSKFSKKFKILKFFQNFQKNSKFSKNFKKFQNFQKNSKFKNFQKNSNFSKFLKFSKWTRRKYDIYKNSKDFFDLGKIIPKTWKEIQLRKRQKSEKKNRNKSDQ